MVVAFDDVNTKEYLGRVGAQFFDTSVWDSLQHKTEQRRDIIFRMLARQGQHRTTS